MGIIKDISVFVFDIRELGEYSRFPEINVIFGIFVFWEDIPKQTVKYPKNVMFGRLGTIWYRNPGIGVSNQINV